MKSCLTNDCRPHISSYFLAPPRELFPPRKCLLMISFWTFAMPSVEIDIYPPKTTAFPKTCGLTLKLTRKIIPYATKILLKWSWDSRWNIKNYFPLLFETYGFHYFNKPRRINELLMWVRYLLLDMPYQISLYIFTMCGAKMWEIQLLGQYRNMTFNSST